MRKGDCKNSEARERAIKANRTQTDFIVWILWEGRKRNCVSPREFETNSGTFRQYRHLRKVTLYENTSENYE